MEDMVTMVKDIKDLSPEELKALSIYFDATGKFPFDATDGSKHFLICVYKNYIHAELLPNRSAQAYVKAYRAAIMFFRSKGHVFSLARLDNETSAELEHLLDTELKIAYQYISAGSHRANKAERAIRSWKNHFIAGLATVDPNFPMSLWHELKVQAEITLNHLRPYASNPAISAYEGIFGHKYDFLAHPLAPVGTKVLIYDPADSRRSWAPHGTPGFILGPAIHHYRSQLTYVPDTKGQRFTDQCSFHPVPFKFPGASTEELLLSAIDSLHQTVKDTTATPADLSAAIQSLVESTAHLRTGHVPPGPAAPDGLSAREVAAITTTPIVVSTPTLDTTTSAPQPVTLQRVPDDTPATITPPRRQKKVRFNHDLPLPPVEPVPVSAQRVPDLAPPTLPEPPQRVPETQPPTMNRHPLRTEKATRPANPDWRTLTPIESRSFKNVERRRRIGQHFKDTDTGEEYIIDSVVMPTVDRGPGSQTPTYRYFLVSEYTRPTALREFEYTRCSEIQRAKWVQWIARGQSAFACAILASTPRDPNRALNQNLDGTPLTKRAALKLDPELWTSCREEEWHRLLENTLIPIYANNIPLSERNNVAYYNEQIKEKLKVVDGEEFVEARVRGTLGGNVITFDGPTSANTAEYPMINMILSAVLHDVKFVDPETRFINLDMVDYYLFSPMEKTAYMRHKLSDIPAVIVEEYGLAKYAIQGYINFEVVMSMYGHPASGRLANKLLMKTIEPEGYYEDRLVPCLIKHKTLPTIGTLVVDDLGLKVAGEANLMHIVHAIEKVWKVKINRLGNKFVGMDLKWDYNPLCPSLQKSSNVATQDGLKRFYPGEVLKGADAPSLFRFPIGRDGNPLPPPPPPTPLPSKTQFIQQFAGTYSHQGRTTRPDIVHAVNEIALTQSAPNTDTVGGADHLANYLARYPEAYVEYKATDMILRVHYDSSLKSEGRHRTGGILYHSNSDAKPEEIGNLIEAVSKSPPNRVASIAEGEYCAQFILGQKGYYHRVVLEAMGYPQPATAFYGDNTTATGIANDTVKIKQAKAIDKAYHWFRDKVRLGEFTSHYIPSALSASNYLTKSLSPSDHHREISQIIKFPPPNPHNPSIRRKYRK